MRKIGSELQEAYERAFHLHQDFLTYLASRKKREGLQSAKAIEANPVVGQRSDGNDVNQLEMDENYEDPLARRAFLQASSNSSLLANSLRIH